MGPFKVFPPTLKEVSDTPRLKMSVGNVPVSEFRLTSNVVIRVVTNSPGNNPVKSLLSTVRVLSRRVPSSDGMFPIS
eukprot:CAMPEP_0118680700 /NCGR_PEP_ID=MMETSP0800-20121206/4516_1 /TAXON_ID=210618 ORGANISM="Striatella unipunctata, Strain CCMP2910" /NCGR_SAMPLE_ID=MMETSP0800 /ASSEMBLY_ACC=CAM_ASM_000638 /LENGTH=76 /DNA_ID=CAMNT_0006576889 /DNA_START=330 /DNA_END=560 /DNA_ORIENTATION=-